MEDAIQDLISNLNRGGYVMIPLLLLSILSVALILERCWFWLVVGSKGTASYLDTLNSMFRRGKTDQIELMIGKDNSPYGKVANELLSEGTSDAVAMGAIESQRPRIDRFMVALSTIITAAPLLGILGTVVGIIQSFQLLGEQSTLTDPTDVAGGIAAALLTTAAGLIIALITLFPYMIFRGWSNRSLGRLESMIASAQQGETNK